MSIRGTLEKKETNDWGYTTIWVSKTRYGADKKGQIPAEVGDLVEFTAFDKPGKDGKVWPTVQLATFRKVSGSSAGNDSGTTAAVPAAPPRSAAPANSGSRDTYWADKAAEDAKKDPRIVYQSSYDRAISFVDLAIRNGAFEALTKAKQTSKLEILQAFVDEQADRIMRQVYAAKVPATEPDKPQKQAKAAVVAEQESDPEESWS